MTAVSDARDLDPARLLASGYEVCAGGGRVRCRFCGGTAALAAPGSTAFLRLLNHETTHRFASGEYSAAAWAKWEAQRPAPTATPKRWLSAAQRRAAGNAFD